MSAITIRDLTAERTLDRQAAMRVTGGGTGLFRAVARQYAMQRLAQKFSQRFALPFAFAQTLAIGVSAPQVQYAFVQQTAVAIGDNNRIAQNVTLVQNQTG